MDSKEANETTRDAWNQNAAFWDQRMGEGNDFVNVLCWPNMERLLEPKQGMRVLDIACGNGLTSRRLAAHRAQVTAFDFSSAMIGFARARTNTLEGIEYLVLDATDESTLVKLGTHAFEAALCNMALFDMAEIDPLFRALATLLCPGGCFVFSVLHPCFNSSHMAHSAEKQDLAGIITTNYSMRIYDYITPSTSQALAIEGQPRAQLIFHRPLQVLLQAGFEAGFYLDGLVEPAFPADHPLGRSELGWNAHFHEFPPVLICRMRLAR